MAIGSKARLKLKKLMKQLETYRGKHTELVSVYVPAGYDINKITNHLQQEQGTATNIKSASTRKNVIDALERMIQHIKLFNKTPENGLVLFSGNVSEREGQSDVQVWSFEPPIPLKQRLYRCDKEFIIEPLQEMITDKDFYGLVVLDRRDATIALLKGKSIIPLKRTHSEVPGKTRAGGQSAPRFQRLREGALKQHYKKVADYMKDEFFKLEGLKGIIVGGPSTTVHDFLNKDYLTADVKNKIIGTKDLSYTDEFGLQELVDQSQDLLAAEEVIDEKKIMGKFFEMLSIKPGMVSYGHQDVKKNLEMGAVDVLLVSEDVEDKIVEELEEMCETVGTELKMISLETREGVQLQRIGGFGAILRYEVR